METQNYFCRRCEKTHTVDAPCKLDCGHELFTNSSNLEIGTGYATTNEGKRICYTCATARQRESMKTAQKYVGYLSGGAVTDWAGGVLAEVVGHKRVTKQYTPNGSQYELVTFRAKDVHGGLWSCRGTGDGMIVHMTRINGRKRNYCSWRLPCGDCALCKRPAPPGLGHS